MNNLSHPGVKFLNNQEALIMQNQNALNNVVNSYCKAYSKSELSEFHLVLRGELDEKLKELIEYYKERENLNDIEIIEIVISHGLVRCYRMSYLLVKQYLFKISEVDRDVDIYEDMICIVEEKEDLISDAFIKYENFWIKESLDRYKQKQFNVTKTEIDDIVSISLTISGRLLRDVEDCLNVFHQEYNYSSEKTLAHMIRVGINHAHALLRECCSTSELIENDIFAYD